MSFDSSEKATPPTLALKPENSASPHMFLKLLPQHWSSERVILSGSKFVCRLFKRNPCDSSHPPSHSVTFSAVLHSQELWDLSSQPWSIRLGRLCGIETPRFSRGHIGGQNVLLIFNCHMRVWDQPILCLCPSY